MDFQCDCCGTMIEYPCVYMGQILGSTCYKKITGRSYTSVVKRKYGKSERGIWVKADEFITKELEKNPVSLKAAIKIVAKYGGKKYVDFVTACFPSHSILLQNGNAFINLADYKASNLDRKVI